jgi:hypothetical protein
MSGEPRQCIVPYPPTTVQKSFVWGRPPPYIKDWADIMRYTDPLELMAYGIGNTEGQPMRYVDVSTLNNRERYAFLAGLGGGSLGGSSLGNALGATAAPYPVCSPDIWSTFGYECQHWSEYTAEQQSGILAAAKSAQAVYNASVEQVRAGATNEGELAKQAADNAVAYAQASVDAAEAAVKAACDPPVRDELIAQSDDLHGMAADYAEEAGIHAQNVYAIANKGYQNDAIVMSAVEAAGGAAAAAGDAVKNSEDARQAAIAAAKAKQCAGPTPPPPPPVEEEKKKQGVQHAGMLWVGLILLGTVGAYALMKKKKHGARG